jgi:transposase
MIPYFNIPSGSIHLYQKPVSLRFGEKKLTELCRQALGRGPEVNELFMFYNSRRDAVKLFWRDGNGYQELSKFLPRGGFLLPAPEAGDTFLTVPRKKLDALFRSK